MNALHYLPVTRFGYKCEMPETIIVSLPNSAGAFAMGPADLVGFWILNQTTDVRTFNIELENDHDGCIVAKMTGSLSEHHILSQIAKLAELFGLIITSVQDADFDLVYL